MEQGSQDRQIPFIQRVRIWSVKEGSRASASVETRNIVLFRKNINSLLLSPKSHGLQLVLPLPVGYVRQAVGRMG